MILEFRVRIARPSQHAYFVVFVVFAGRDEAMSCGRRDKCGARGRWEPLRAGGCAGNRGVFFINDGELGSWVLLYVIRRDRLARSETASRHMVSSRGVLQVSRACATRLQITV